MDPATLEVAADTVWVMITGFLVFFMNTGLRHAGNRPVPTQERGQHPGQELHRLRASLDRVLGDRLRPDVRRRQRYWLVGTEGLPAAGGRQQPGHRDAYQGV